ncbi:hypothetical protein LD024_13225 [Citrobacter werkmanii]|uniref:hypothetical protein n=1 Tax=Citrobacter werkmanii TaxID=67827 RepID=UPI001D0A7F8D|nr:hypothetical protein [Citrobacter werkmanii]UBX42938.1 hypothetical protein LD024_13225 [Citrobacter werkmanii]
MKITATILDAYALANSAKSYIEMLKDKKVTMAYILKDWNVCVEQSHFTGVFDFPVDGYTRKAQIIADLENAIKQLNAYVEPSAETAEMQAIQLQHCFDCMARGKDTSNIIWNEEDTHAEALIVCASTAVEDEVQIIDNSTNEALQMTTTNMNAVFMTLAEAVGNFVLEKRDDVEVVTTEQVEAFASAIAIASNPIEMAVSMAHTLTGVNEHVCRNAIVALAQGAEAQA